MITKYGCYIYGVWHFWDGLKWSAPSVKPVGKVVPRPTKDTVSVERENGLPPVGCECGLTLGAGMFPHVKITYMGDGVFCYLNINNGNEYTGSLRDAIFTPRRTKEQRQKDELVELIEAERDNYFPKSVTAEEIADAILSRYNLEPKDV